MRVSATTSTKLPPVLLAVVLLYLAVLGLISTDFGLHWDESALLWSVQHSVSTGLLLPRWYNYPSLSYDVSMLTALPHAIRHAVKAWGTEAGLGSDELLQYLSEPAFHLQLRSVFFVLSILAAWPVYVLARRLSGSAWIGLFAGLTSVTAWELVYHARWIAPDGLAVLFVSAAVCSQYRILNGDGRSLAPVIVSAIFAGLCLGAKYPCGMVLLPLVLAIVMSAEPPARMTWPTLRLVATGLAVAAAVFVVTTPGSLLEPLRFLRDLRFEMVHYSQGHSGYTVEAGWDHLSKVVAYLATVLLSKNAVIATSASALAAVGAVSLVKTRPRVGIWLLSLPILYLLYMSGQRTLIVRNYLLILPFLAVLASLGLLFLLSASQGRRGLRVLLCTAAASGIAYNLAVATKSSLGIFRPDPSSARAAIESRIASDPETMFFLSAASAQALGRDVLSRQDNVAATLGQAQRLIFFSNEVADSKLLVANVAGRYRTVWSRLEEVNWDFYPSWKGHHRVLEVSTQEPELERLVSKIALAAPALSGPMRSQP